MRLVRNLLQIIFTITRRAYIYDYLVETNKYIIVSIWNTKFTVTSRRM
jgi:hypothetical protein